MADEYRVLRWEEEAAPDAMRAKETLQSDGYTSFQWSDSPGAYYPEHSHPDDQSHFILSGTLELNVKGVGTVVLGPGDRDLMPAGTVHSARVAGDEPVVYLIGSKS
ncbi:MAG TPA: cupin domain-containing protein [Pyrinomonadaceae bacterium]|nr:cupin domain-containing protein [Pyrinomonadaceae bacterium]